MDALTHSETFITLLWFAAHVSPQSDACIFLVPSERIHTPSLFPNFLCWRLIYQSLIIPINPHSINNNEKTRKCFTLLKYPLDLSRTLLVDACGKLNWLEFVQKDTHLCRLVTLLVRTKQHMMRSKELASDFWKRKTWWCIDQDNGVKQMLKLCWVPRCTLASNYKKGIRLEPPGLFLELLVCPNRVTDQGGKQEPEDGLPSQQCSISQALMVKRQVRSQCEQKPYDSSGANSQTSTLIAGFQAVSVVLHLGFCPTSPGALSLLQSSCSVSCLPHHPVHSTTCTSSREVSLHQWPRCVRRDPAFALPSGSACPFGLWVILPSSMAGLFSLEVSSPEVLPFSRTPRDSCLLVLQPSGHLLEVFCCGPAQCSGYCPEIPSPTFLFPVHWPPVLPSGGMCPQSALCCPFV